MTALLSEKLDFGYQRIDLSNMHPSFIILINTFYCRGDCKKRCPKINRRAHGPGHWQDHINEDLKDIGNVNNFIHNYIDNLNNLYYDFIAAERIIGTIISYLVELIAIKGGKNPQS